MAGDAIAILAPFLGAAEQPGQAALGGGADLGGVGRGWAVAGAAPGRVETSRRESAVIGGIAPSAGGRVYSPYMNAGALQGPVIFSTVVRTAAAGMLARHARPNENRHALRALASLLFAAAPAVKPISSDEIAVRLAPHYRPPCKACR